MAGEGKRALVVGGTSGIGLATARLLLARGLRVAVAGRDPRRLEAAGREGLLPVALDAASAEALARHFAGSPTLDVLVLALSGAKGAGAFRDLDLADLEEGLRAKTLAQLRTLQAALPRLAPEASVTFVSAASSGAAIPGTAGLAAINAALEAVVPVLAVELAPIRVNAVAPGLVDTPWWDALPPASRQAYFAGAAQRLPVGRVASAPDVAEVVALAATNRNLTGAVIPCDGGGRWTLGRAG